MRKKKQGDDCYICGELKPFDDLDIDCQDRAVCIDCQSDYLSEYNEEFDSLEDKINAFDRGK